MTVSELTSREAVLAALDEFDRIGRAAGQEWATSDEIFGFLSRRQGWLFGPKPRRVIEPRLV